MITFEGVYFNGVNSKAYPVTMLGSGDGLLLHSEEEDLSVDVKLSDLTLVPSLGNTRRVLALPGGARCETSDLAAVAELERLWGQQRRMPGRGMRLVQRLESHWRLVIVCALCLLVILWGFVAYGIPWMATQAVLATPPKLVELISTRSLAFLDQHIFAPSRLTEARQENLQARFRTLVHRLGVSARSKLVFRHSPKMGANALALPSGLIIMTDELIHLARDDREIIGILVHEIAHVEQRHGLRNMYQSTGIFLLISMLTGDVASMTSTASSLPTFLIESGYSRQFETAADTFAGLYMLQRGWGTQPLRDILQRLSGDQHKGLPTFLSTHPGSVERLRHLEALERDFMR